MESSTKPRVLITGVTGYLGSQVLQEFLVGEGANQFTIRATVRDKSNQEKFQPLVKMLG